MVSELKPAQFEKYKEQWALVGNPDNGGFTHITLGKVKDIKYEHWNIVLVIEPANADYQVGEVPSEKKN